MDVASSEGRYNERAGIARRGGSVILAQSTREQSRDPVHGADRHYHLINDQFVNFNDHTGHHHHGPRDNDILIHDHTAEEYHDHHIDYPLDDYHYGPADHDHKHTGGEHHSDQLVQHDDPYGHRVDAPGDWSPGS